MVRLVRDFRLFGVGRDSWFLLLVGWGRGRSRRIGAPVWWCRARGLRRVLVRRVGLLQL